MAISEELELDISGALDAIESLNEPLTQLGESLTLSLNSAIDAVDVQPLVDQLASLDASGVTTTIDAAVDQVDGTVPVDADTAEIPVAVDEALQALTDLAVPVGADGTEIPADIDFALEALTDLAVPVDADASSFGGSIDEALNDINATVIIEADASDIPTEVDAELTEVDAEVEVTATVDAEGIDELTTDAEGATGAIEGIGTSSTIAGSIASGSFEGVASTVVGATGAIGGVAAGIFGVFGVLAKAGIELKGSIERARQAAGPFFDDLRTVNVGTLNTELGTLATRLGSTEAALLASATNAFVFAKNSGFSGEAAAEFADNVVALAARAVALNPALGSVDEVAARLQKQLLSGKGLTNFIGQVDDATLATKALEISGKALPEELTKQDLALARAAIGAEKYGGSIDKDINKGSKNAIIQQRSLNASIQDFLANVGKPLVAPFQKILAQSLPIVKALAPIFADLGKDALPSLAQSLEDAAPTIQLFGETLRALTPLIRILQGVVNVVANPLGQIALLRDAFAGLASAFTGLGGIIGGVIGQIGSIGGDIIGGLLSGLESAAGAVLEFFTRFPVDKIITPIKQALGIASPSSVFVEIGVDILTGLLNGLASVLGTVLNFFTSLPGEIVAAVGPVLGTLFEKGVDLLEGLGSGLGNRIVGIFNFFRTLPGEIVRNIPNPLKILVDVGRRIIDGLIQGIEKGLGPLGRFVGGIGKFIRDHKPIATDHLILKDAGVAIIQGLADSMEDTLPVVEKTLSDLSDTIADTKIESPQFVPAALPIPGISKLPAVAAALPSAAASASTVGFQSSAQAAAQGLGTGIRIDNLIVQTTAPNQTQVGIEVARQLRAESFRAGR